jgi:hypothetical protein
MSLMPSELVVWIGIRSALFYSWLSLFFSQMAHRMTVVLVGASEYGSSVRHVRSRLGRLEMTNPKYQDILVLERTGINRGRVGNSE